MPLCPAYTVAWFATSCPKAQPKRSHPKDSAVPVIQVTVTEVSDLPREIGIQFEHKILVLHSELKKQKLSICQHVTPCHNTLQTFYLYGT